MKIFCSAFNAPLCPSRVQIQPRYLATKPEQVSALGKLFSRPSWSTKLMITKETGKLTGGNDVSPSQIERLLLLSALPAPKDSVQKEKLIQDIREQLQFVDEVRKIDTKDVEPLRSLTADQNDDDADALDYEDAMKQNRQLDDDTSNNPYDYPKLASRLRHRYYTVSGGLVNDLENNKD